MTLSVFDAAAESPSRPAVVAGNAVITYRELARLVDRAAGELAREGVGRGARIPVGIVASPELPVLVWLFALAEMHWPWVPLHPGASQQERTRLLDQAGAGWVIDSNTLTSLSAKTGVPVVDGETLALIPTSGTTRQPKLVMLPRRAFLASAAASAANLGWLEQDRWLVCMPLAHVGGVSVLTRCLLARRCVVLLEGGRFDVEAVMTAVQRSGVTLMSAVPTMLHRMLEREPRWDPPGQLRAVLLGGAGASRRLLGRGVDRGWPILTTYGLTEACSQVTTQSYGTVQRGEAGSGRVLRGVEVRIEQGVVQVRGRTMMSGILGEPDPFLPGGWFATGDCGAWDERGNLHILGRRTELIVTGGENVYPSEVEQVLEECPGVEKACVFGVEDDEWGQVVAAAVAGSATEGEVARFAGERLARFKRPRLLRVGAEIFWTESGKPDRVRTAAAAMRGMGRLGPVA